jgi:predicted nucleic acid-binding protein
MIVVSNSGPLIALAQINNFELLKTLYNRLYIPPAVQEEVVGLGRGRAGAVEVDLADWIKIVEVQNRTAIQLLRGQLDLGESQAIVLALELQANLLLIDEARGRRIAQAQGLNVTKLFF